METGYTVGTVSTAIKKPALYRVKRVFLTLIGVLIILGAFGYITWLYLDAKSEAQQLIENPQAAATAAFQDTLDKIGKLILLPDDEAPTLATVSDAEKLKEQPFFAKAANDDKVLIYTKNKLAILYRPSDNKIISVGTVNLEATNP